MAKNLIQKILEEHLVEGTLIPGREIAVKIDHTLLQDATGTMAMLEFESLGLESVGAELAAQRGHTPIRLEVKPSFANILLWKVIYESYGGYYTDAVRAAFKNSCNHGLFRFLGHELG